MKRIDGSIEEGKREPCAVLGTPDALPGNLSVHWSRHIDDTLRPVYRSADEAIVLVACRLRCVG